ncbi:MAG: SMP-30/gluconolactonase/LRE family protein [Microcella sp.]
MIEQLTGPELEHGEGPQWFSDISAWRCVDMLRGDIVGVDSANRVVRRNVGTVAAMVRPRRGGGAVVLREHDLILFGADPLSKTTFSEGPTLLTNPDVRLNEGACDPLGRLVCGSMAYDTRPGGGSLYRVSATAGSDSYDIETLRSAVGISNGVAFSPDGRFAYYVDSMTHRVERIEYGATGFHPAGVLIDLADEEGMPDGLCMDEKGLLWLAMFGGGCVLAISPSGAIVERIELPTTQVTACAFVGDKLDRLLVTTSTLGATGDALPTAGALFLCTTGTRGVPAFAFNG